MYTEIETFDNLMTDFIESQKNDLDLEESSMSLEASTDSSDESSFNKSIGQITEETEAVTLKETKAPKTSVQLPTGDSYTALRVSGLHGDDLTTFKQLSDFFAECPGFIHESIKFTRTKVQNG